jgi:hypothetical protein
MGGGNKEGCRARKRVAVCVRLNGGGKRGLERDGAMNGGGKKRRLHRGGEMMRD